MQSFLMSPNSKAKRTLSLANSAMRRTLGSGDHVSLPSAESSSLLRDFLSQCGQQPELSRQVTSFHNLPKASSLESPPSRAASALPLLGGSPGGAGEPEIATVGPIGSKSPKASIQVPPFLDSHPLADTALASAFQPSSGQPVISSEIHPALAPLTAAFFPSPDDVALFPAAATVAAAESVLQDPRDLSDIPPVVIRVQLGDCQDPKLPPASSGVTALPETPTGPLAVMPELPLAQGLQYDRNISATMSTIPEDGEEEPEDCCCVWHEVTAKPFKDPVSGKRAILLMQSDVTLRVRAENILTGLSEGQASLYNWCEMIGVKGICVCVTAQGLPSGALGTYAMLHMLPPLSS